MRLPLFVVMILSLLHSTEILQAQSEPEFDGVYIRTGDTFVTPLRVTPSLASIDAITATGNGGTRFSSSFSVYRFQCITADDLRKAPVLPDHALNKGISLFLKGRNLDMSFVLDLVHIQDIASTIKPLPSKGAMQDFGNQRVPTAGQVRFYEGRRNPFCDNMWGYPANGLQRKTLSDFSMEYFLQSGSLGWATSADAFKVQRLPIMGRIIRTTSGESYLFRTEGDVRRLKSNHPGDS